MKIEYPFRKMPLEQLAIFGGGLMDAAAQQRPGAEIFRALATELGRAVSTRENMGRDIKAIELDLADVTEAAVRDAFDTLAPEIDRLTEHGYNRAALLCHAISIELLDCLKDADRVVSLTVH